MRPIKDFIWLVLVLVVPVLMYFSPVIISIMKDDYWYLFLFFVSWMPALIWAKAVTFIYDNTK